jgi:hypothetical protein
MSDQEENINKSLIILPNEEDCDEKKFKNQEIVKEVPKHED